jgi:peptide/nickel transport system ATP-binding protein
LTPDPSMGVPDSQLGAVYPNPVDPPSGCTFHPRCAQVMDVCSEIRPDKVVTPSGHVECHLYKSLS